MFKVFCFGFAALLLFWHAWDKSATYDEVGHIQGGYYHWQHLDFERGLEHPPLLRLLCAFPLNFLDLQDPEVVDPIFLKKPLSVHREILYGMALLYQNAAASAEKILMWSRGIMILLTLFFFGLVYCWSKEIYGETGGTLSLFLLATTPSYLAHGSLVTTDVGGVASALLALYALSHYLNDDSTKNLWMCGLAFGIAQACKHSNIILIPIFSVAFLAPLPSIGKPFWSRLLRLFVVFLVSGLVLNVCYGFQDFLPPHELHPDELEAYRWPSIVQFMYRWMPLPDFFLKSIGFMTYHVRQGFPAFFWGKVLPEGVWYYFPAAFILKTPLLILAVLCFTFYSFLKKAVSREELLLLFTLIVYTVTTSFSKLNLGIRHFLFVYPLLYILAGRTASHLKFAGKNIILILAVLFQLFEVLLTAPHFLAYFNLAVGGAKYGMRYLADMDLGQDLKPLGKFLEKEPSAEVILSYFGTALPRYYKVDAQELLPTGTQLHSPKINSDDPAKEFLAVSMVHLCGLMVGRETFQWLRGWKPMKVFGHSIALYDITNDLESHERLAKIYERINDWPKAERHLRRARILKGKIQRGT